MSFTTDKIVSISEANQNFSRTARLADKLGEVYIFKNNKPKYRLTVIDGDEEIAIEPETEAETDTEVDEVSEKKLTRLLSVMKKYPKAFKELLRISDK
jgi:antitoxin Phd